jgi:hypothetical protein
MCLQFTLTLGFCPVFHRPTSLVIHRLESKGYDIESNADFIIISRLNEMGGDLDSLTESR